MLRIIFIFLLFSGAQAIRFDDWLDQTDPPVGLERFGVVKVLCIKDPITFADALTAANVTQQREQYKAAHRHRDVGMVIYI